MVLSKDIEDITRDELDYILSIELPTGQEYTDEVKAKFAEAKKHFGIEDKTKTAKVAQIQTDKNTTTQNEWKSKGQTANATNYKKYDYGYDKKKSNKTQYKNR